MAIPQQYTFDRYLRSKRTVDDRALNADVMNTVLSAMPTDRPARIAELGGGVGTMIDRLIGTGRIARAEYLLVDMDPQLLAEADTLVEPWRRGQPRAGEAVDEVSFDVSTVHARLEDWVRDTEGPFDLVIAHAVLDLVDVPAVLPTLLERLGDDGLFWPTINFDGDTIFTPKDPRDEALMAAYHRSMDVRTGSSTAGRELFEQIRAAGGAVAAAGSSDWVVYGDEGGYIADEAYFVHHIVDTVEAELMRVPQLRDDVRGWAALRHAQVEDGTLVYIAHQLDFAVRRGRGRG
ncbi:MAG: class I SAM-dependent methyltransferase [Myxococcota bacterium]